MIKCLIIVEIWRQRRIQQIKRKRDKGEKNVFYAYRRFKNVEKNLIEDLTKECQLKFDEDH